MVLNKKAQGLPLHLIVIAAIAALVLVLVIAFTIGGFGSFFGKIFQSGQTVVGDTTDVARTTCSGYCDTAKSSLTTTSWKSSQYCTKTFNIDKDGSGDLVENEKDEMLDEVGIHCWQDDILTKCSAIIAGTPVDEEDCV